MMKDTTITIEEISSGKKYGGGYVAYDAARSRKVIASGPDAAELFVEVRKMDVSLPTIVYIPKLNDISIY